MTTRPHSITCPLDCDGWPCDCWCHHGPHLDGQTELDLDDNGDAT